MRQQRPGPVARKSSPKSVDPTLVETPQPAGQASRKFRTIAELGAIAAAARRDRHAVVLAHGTFDVLHMGHVRHLELARKHGSILLVTVTADDHVHKGPGRPIFPADIRAEMLAALECVDWVGVNHEADAVNLLETVKPSVYVKGSDYRDPEADVTGMITAERQAVERHGGRLVFTDDITFSSSALINRHLDVFEPELRGYLDQKRDQGLLERLVALVDRVRDFRVLVVGETIIDDYTYVSTLGKSAKEGIIATLVEGREVFAGGVIAAANHVAGLCREVEVLTVSGEGDPHEELVRRSLKPNVRLTLSRLPGVPTTRKLRYIEKGYMRKMFEVYFMDDRPLKGAPEKFLIDALERRARDFDLVIAADFGHGMITPRTLAALVEHAPFLAVNAQSNAANRGFNLISRYPRADYVCIDAPEAQLAISDKHADIADIAGEKLPSRIDCDRISITHGVHGCAVYQRGVGTHLIPAFTKKIVDTVGAGDAFFAITAPLVAAGGDMEEVGIVGNAAGALKVNIVGHRQSVEKAPLLKFIETLLK